MWFSLRLANSVKGLQGPKDERKHLRLWSSSNKSKMLSSMSVASTVHCAHMVTLQHQTTVAVCFVRWTLLDTMLCEWYSASVFADTVPALYCEPVLTLDILA